MSKVSEVNNDEVITNISEAVAWLCEAAAASTDFLEELEEAAARFAKALSPLFPSGETLPRGYVADRDGLVVHHDKIGYLLVSGYPFGRSRELALRLARDVMNGWLDELAAWLRDRAIKDKTAAEILESAAQALAQKGDKT